MLLFSVQNLSTRRLPLASLLPAKHLSRTPRLSARCDQMVLEGVGHRKNEFNSELSLLG